MPKKAWFKYKHVTTTVSELQSVLRSLTGLPMSVGDVKWRVHTIAFQENGDVQILFEWEGEAHA